MTDILSAGALEETLQQIDSTAGFEVKFNGGNFIAYRTDTNQQVRGHIVPGVNEQNQAMLNRVVTDLRWPPQAAAPVKNRPFRPVLTPQEAYRAKIERYKRLGEEDPQVQEARRHQEHFRRLELPTNITYEPKWIGPEQAEEFLLTFGGVREDDRPVQRNLSDKTVKKYRDLMIVPGAWGLSPDPFAYDLEGRGINGQHRAMAVLYTGLTLPFMVSHGWESRTTFKYLDKNLARTVATTLFLGGETYPTQMRSAAVLLIKAEEVPLLSAWTAAMRPQESQILQVVDQRPALREAVKWAKSGTPKFMNATALTVARALAAEACGQGEQSGVVTYDMDATATFFNALKTGGGIDVGHPAYTIRRYMETAGGEYVRQSERYDKTGFGLFLMLSAYNLWVRKEKLERVSYKGDKMVIPQALRYTGDR